MKKIIIIQTRGSEYLKQALDFSGVRADIAHNEVELNTLLEKESASYDGVLIEPILPVDFLTNSSEEIKDVTLGGVGLNITLKLQEYFNKNTGNKKIPKIFIFSVAYKKELVELIGFPEDLTYILQPTKIVLLAEKIKEET